MNNEQQIRYLIELHNQEYKHDSINNLIEIFN